MLSGNLDAEDGILTLLQAFESKIPHQSAGFLPASFLSMQVGPSGGTQTHEPRGPKPRVLSTELHPDNHFLVFPVCGQSGK